MNQSITLTQLMQRVSRLVTVPETQNVWVVAELSDVAVRGGHCYMELLEKDPNRGTQLARARGIIWASSYGRIATDFLAATGQRLASGLKVMVRASVQMHPVFGMSLIISAIDPDYTLGDLMRRRREILQRLKDEGILDMNRTLEWPQVALRVAVISAKGAAGYGDFINQLYNNELRLRFTTRLFPAIMQGESSAPSIISALNQVAAEDGEWDCVVIIRGGGATSDLECYDNYDLAANIAQFPLPVIIGIGHERDVTVLDYVANMRVKTPTAAAEWLIARGNDLLASLAERAHAIARYVTDRLTGAKEQLSYWQGALPVAPISAVERAKSRLRSAVMAVSQVSARRITPQLARLDAIADNLPTALSTQLARHADRLSAKEQLLEALSPMATLRRGYSITRVNGRAVCSIGQVSVGDTIESVVADGTITSTVNTLNVNNQ